MKQYTEQEFMEEFNDLRVLLVSYYKFCFEYTGEHDGKRVHINVGGSSDDIYRFEPIINDLTPIAELIADTGINHATIYDGDKIIGRYNSNSW